eukprot:CAMPEP_0115835298 /NCGR_PEP_ID=MMETSP0287-20121206/4123_1 /TAXON_ID=412157 /ORGANISM="Chrysochromulina rotalis, Strain UIO044" /LENGTH=131 /DNA_ID=CAMNT_0003288753 /DNA_START=540 /DNA_END=936 /DNA_ORIENTATION=+
MSSNSRASRDFLVANRQHQMIQRVRVFNLQSDGAERSKEEACRIERHVFGRLFAKDLARGSVNPEKSNSIMYSPRSSFPGGMRSSTPPLAESWASATGFQPGVIGLAARSAWKYTTTFAPSTDPFPSFEMT